MNTRKRALCFLLAFVFLFSSFIPAWGYESASTNTSSTQLENYALEAMKRYAGIYALGTSLNMSQPIRIYNRDDNAQAFFLFDGSDCLGMMLISQVNDTFTSSFRQGNYDSIESFLSQKTSFILMAWEKSLFLISNNSIRALTGNADAPSKNLLSDILVDTQPQTLVLTPITLTAQGSSPRSASYTINVPRVLNLESPDTGLGLCWAATAASIIDYWSSSYDELAAMDVYRRLCSEYGTSSGYPYGTKTWIQRAYSTYNVPMTYVGSGATYARVKYLIEEAGCPIHASLRGTSGDHSVVICGFTSAYGYYYYVLMDPNETNYVTAETSNNSTPTINYVSNSGTYTEWFRHFY